MLIYDGYERRITIGSMHVVYRPALAIERRRFRWMVSGLSEASAHGHLERWISQHVVMWDRWRTCCELGMYRFRSEKPDDYEQLLLAINGLVPDDSGELWRDVEPKAAVNLRNGILLELGNPKLALRDCGDCQKYFYNESTGLPIISNVSGEKMLRDGVTMCRTPEGCPKGTPEKPNGLSKMNAWAWRHFRDCEAIGKFPEDPIVMRNASIIRAAIKRHEARLKVK